MVSIIVPIYNAERYLTECLQSIEAQTEKDLEVLMVNDGSTDSSEAIAASFAARDSRFRLISKPNGGPSSARNTGLLESAGEFIMFVDADDAIHPQAVSHLMEPLCGRLPAAMCVAPLKWTHKPAYKIKEGYGIRSGWCLLVDTLYQKRGTQNVVCNCMISRKSIEKAGLFKDGILYEDLDYCFRLLFYSSIVAVSHSVVYFYRKTPESLMKRWTPKRLDVLDVTDALRASARNGGALAAAADSRRFSAYFNMYLLSCANGYKPGAERCWPVIRKLRWKMLTDREVRFKNKAGALLSLLGAGAMAMVGRMQARLGRAR